jgi:uncharacterized protein HemY
MSLGGVLAALGDVAGAKELYSRALETRRKALGSHPSVSASLECLAVLAEAEGRGREAEALRAEAAANLREHGSSYQA